MKHYLHGTRVALDPGDYLVPAYTLGLPPLIKTSNQPRYSPLWVYLTESRQYADVFAGDGGWVYAVSPIGPVERDPDARLAWRCRRALVLAVLARPVRSWERPGSPAGPPVPPGPAERAGGGS